MQNNDYVMGKLDGNTWRGNEAQQLTFVVTQDCNLRCKYCYMIDKNDKNIMTFDVAKKIIDYFIDNKEMLFSSDYIILDFIGGEPLLEIDLIEQIVEYFIISTYQKKSKWFGRFRIMIQSNGVLVDNPKVQRFLMRNKNMVTLGITIDGTKVKHDLQRVFPNGKGSYDIVEKNYKMSAEQKYTDSTKVTFSSEDLKYLKESIIHLWSLGIENVPANIVYEDVWKEGDDVVYHEQLVALADYIIDNHLWDKYNTTFFSDSIGFKVPNEDLMHPACGTGNMYCVDANGDIYNCVRFMQYSLDNKESKKIGDIYNGVDRDRVRPLKTLFTKYISEQRCLDCRINLNCTYCAGNNYNLSDNDSMFYRSTAICEMFKAQVRANNYYWARLYNEQHIRRDVKHKREYFMYFILSSDSVNYCKFKTATQKEVMKPEDLLRGLAYAYKNFYQPVFVHSSESCQWLESLLCSDQYGDALKAEMNRHIIKHITKYHEYIPGTDVIYVLDESNWDLKNDVHAPVILNIKEHEINDLGKRIGVVLTNTSRININITDVSKQFDLVEYENQLQKLCDMLYNYISKGEVKEIRQLTDRIFMKKMNNCFAGEKNITFAPDGQFYMCPAFYFDKTITVDMDKSIAQSYLSKSPGCEKCDAYQCERCIYKNLTGTGELNTPTEMQCRISHLERKYSAYLLERLKKSGITEFQQISIPMVDYVDPVEYLTKMNKAKPVCH